MCFGKSDDKASQEMLRMQKEEAEAARQKEAERQHRIGGGLESIRNAFEGAPVMRDVTSSYDWSKFAPPAQANAGLTALRAMGGSAIGTFTGSKPPQQVSGLPAGFTMIQRALPAAAPSRTAYSPQPPQSGGYHGENNLRNTNNLRLVGGGPSGGHYVEDVRTPASAGASGSAGSEWVIQGPDGRIYRQGEALPYTQSVFTGQRSGGIGDEFYNKFKQGILDYYMPQVTDQYGDAKDELTYRLARAGTLRSSAANTETADLAKQNTLNEAKVRSQADTAAADLRSRVSSERAKAEAQLYATENPEVAANQATAAIRNITAESPSLSPLSQIFTLASVGGANFLKGALNQSSINKVRTAAGGDASRLVT